MGRGRGEGNWLEPAKKKGDANYNQEAQGRLELRNSPLKSKLGINPMNVEDERI